MIIRRLIFAGDYRTGRSTSLFVVHRRDRSVMPTADNNFCKSLRYRCMQFITIQKYLIFILFFFHKFSNFICSGVLVSSTVGILLSIQLMVELSIIVALIIHDVFFCLVFYSADHHQIEGLQFRY